MLKFKDYVGRHFLRISTKDSTSTKLSPILAWFQAIASFFRVISPRIIGYSNDVELSDTDVLKKVITLHNSILSLKSILHRMIRLFTFHL